MQHMEKPSRDKHNSYLWNDKQMELLLEVMHEYKVFVWILSKNKGGFKKDVWLLELFAMYHIWHLCNCKSITK